jgi:hypothetical protein
VQQQQQQQQQKQQKRIPSVAVAVFGGYFTS